MIVCLRTLDVPPQERDRFLGWIDDNRAVREEHGIVLEVVLERPGDDTGEYVVVTAWPSNEAFDAWIATPHRVRLTASDVHESVNFRPITRYAIAGGYINKHALLKEICK